MDPRSFDIIRKTPPRHCGRWWGHGHIALFQSFKAVSFLIDSPPPPQKNMITNSSSYHISNFFLSYINWAWQWTLLVSRHITTSTWPAWFLTIILFEFSSCLQTWFFWFLPVFCATFLTRFFWKFFFCSFWLDLVLDLVFDCLQWCLTCNLTLFLTCSWLGS